MGTASFDQRHSTAGYCHCCSAADTGAAAGNVNTLVHFPPTITIRTGDKVVSRHRPCKAPTGIGGVRLGHGGGLGIVLIGRQSLLPLNLRHDLILLLFLGSILSLIGVDVLVCSVRFFL